MIQVPEMSASSPLATQLAALQAQGALVLHGLLDPQQLAALNTQLDPMLDAQQTARRFMSEGVARFYGSKTRHLTGLPAWSSRFVQDVMCHPALLGLADAVLLPNCTRYQLNLAHVFDRGPGARQQHIHRDEQVWVHLPQPHAEVELSCVVALVDFTADNGATRLVPGSHRWPRDRQPEAADIAVAAMPAGSAVVYLGSTLHGGGPNTTTSIWRRGLHMSYVVGWLRTEENHFLSTPPAVARSLSPTAQALLGYAVHNAEAQGGGYIGSLDLQDPMALMREGAL